MDKSILLEVRYLVKPLINKMSDWPFSRLFKTTGEKKCPIAGKYLLFNIQIDHLIHNTNIVQKKLRMLENFMVENILFLQI